MDNFAEKVKAFLNDKEKVQALAKDEEFIGKVAGGKATPKAIAKKFEELGLQLSEDQTERIRKTTVDIMNMPVEKLQDETSLQSIVGGTYKTSDSMEIGGILAGAASGVAALACTVGYIACNIQASKAKKSNNLSEKEKYKNLAQNLSIAAISFAGGAVLGAGIAGAGRISNILDSENS